MTKIANNITELMGNTPLVKLSKITKDVKAEIVPPNSSMDIASLSFEG